MPIGLGAVARPRGLSGRVGAIQADSQGPASGRALPILWGNTPVAPRVAPPLTDKAICVRRVRAIGSRRSAGPWKRRSNAADLAD